jgi:hypothetical protein
MAHQLQHSEGQQTFTFGLQNGNSNNEPSFLKTQSMHIQISNDLSADGRRR